ncbi:hypothetical protein GL272_19420 [Aeromonas veronii]|uniref:hypothetical protein n=1 Tax=Aeromonas TaxID=642 RepID=UPI000640A099|nr:MULTISPECIES: hypothetical protein [Aeromonas]AKJ36902.1 hypothetical protein U876_23995 [Aeromonas hydrophila NJ-35]ALZ82611.1 hypothetical protein AhyD4_23690 [Aeromonas hydrophila]MBW3762744.1 hypothetical protein [Aeromonas jandaei]MBW3779046.1 hypothetical protein [Aeromonas veronii]QGW99162.1 hypothetical protein FGM04_21745 [Aeromonas veronii]
MLGGKWDGKISNLNISDQAFPELHAELSKMNHKARSDRLRSLALLGLYSLQISGKMTTPESPVQPLVTPENDGVNSRKQLLKNKLLDSV